MRERERCGPTTTSTLYKSFVKLKIRTKKNPSPCSTLNEFSQDPHHLSSSASLLSICLGSMGWVIKDIITSCGSSTSSPSASLVATFAVSPRRCRSFTDLRWFTVVVKHSCGVERCLLLPEQCMDGVPQQVWFQVWWWNSSYQGLFSSKYSQVLSFYRVEN